MLQFIYLKTENRKITVHPLLHGLSCYRYNLDRYTIVSSKGLEGCSHHRTHDMPSTTTTSYKLHARGREVNGRRASCMLIHILHSEDHYFQSLAIPRYYRTDEHGCCNYAKNLLLMPNVRDRSAVKLNRTSSSGTSRQQKTEALLGWSSRLDVTTKHPNRQYEYKNLIQTPEQ